MCEPGDVPALVFESGVEEDSCSVPEPRVSHATDTVQHNAHPNPQWR